MNASVSLLRGRTDNVKFSSSPGSVSALPLTFFLMHFVPFLCKFFCLFFAFFSPLHVVHRCEKAKYQLGVHLSPVSCLLPPSQRSCIVQVPFVPEEDPWIVTHSSLALVITWLSTLFDLTCCQLYQNQNCRPLFC